MPRQILPVYSLLRQEDGTGFQIIGFLDIGIVKCGQDSPADTAFLDKMTNSERAHLLIQIGRMFRDVELDPFFLHA